jgi:hypothetical protein
MNSVACCLLSVVLLAAAAGAGAQSAWMEFDFCNQCDTAFCSGLTVSATQQFSSWTYFDNALCSKTITIQPQDGVHSVEILADGGGFANDGDYALVLWRKRGDASYLASSWNIAPADSIVRKGQVARFVAFLDGTTKLSDVHAFKMWLSSDAIFCTLYYDVSTLVKWIANQESSPSYRGISAKVSLGFGIVLVNQLLRTISQARIASTCCSQSRKPVCARRSPSTASLDTPAPTTAAAASSVCKVCFHCSIVCFIAYCI